MTTILFVDDEPGKLAELRHMVRAYRSEWTMEFCAGPEEALSAMSEQSFDAVVADLRMPGMDGAELLTRIRDLYPDTVRIILSGQSERERILRAVGPAHQFLSKPCDPEVLHAAITRATLLHKRLHSPELKALVSRMDSVPSLPDTYYEVVEELQREDASVDRVGTLISGDVGMTAKVLQLVNSSYFGLRVHIQDAQHAAAMLGLNTLKPLVLTASIFRQLEQLRVSTAFLEQVLSHSMEVGGISKQLAKLERTSSETVDNCFIGGALHDIGKIVLADNLGRDYAALCQQAKAQGSLNHELELEQLGASHAEVGGYLLSLWGLPQEIVEAAAYHHEPAASGDESFTCLTAVHAANVLCCEGEELAGGECVLKPLDEDYLIRLGLANRIEAWREATADVKELV